MLVNYFHNNRLPFERARRIILPKSNNMTMFRLHFLAFLFFGSASLHAQIPTFKLRHGTSSNDEARYVTVLADNSFIVAGSSAGGGLGGTDAMLVKFSAAGAVEWSQAYGGSGNDFFNYILDCSDGNYIAVGETNSFGAGGIDIYVVKFDANGTVLWERTCGGSSAETGRGISETSDGYVVSGATQSVGQGFWDIFVEKLDFNGDSQWRKVWGGGGGDMAGYTLSAANGDIWVTGFIFMGGNNHDAILFRLNSDGELQSANRITLSNNDITTYIIPGGAGMTACGQTWSYSNGNVSYPWIISYNNSGGLVWGQYYPVPNGNYETRIETTPDGGFIFAPTHMSADISQGYLIKTNGSGSVVWSKSYAYQGNGRLYHAKSCPDGGYLAVGYSSGAARDMFILKTNAEGNLESCCPTDAGIVAVGIVPPTSTVSPVATTGPASAAGSGQNSAVSLTETDLCNGPLCCLTDAGNMIGISQTVCINQDAVFTHNGDEELESGDLLQFILYTSPANPLGTILATANTPNFSYNPATMQTGQTYYVAAIAGNNVGGNVNLNDPCLDISNAGQLTWRALPGVLLQLNNPDVCPGNCRAISATFTGTPPYTLTVNNPFTGDFTVNFNTNSGGFQICPPPGTPAGSFTVQAVALTDAFCACP
jgi:hypothetical protein